VPFNRYFGRDAIALIRLRSKMQIGDMEQRIFSIASENVVDKALKLCSLIVCFFSPDTSFAQSGPVCPHHDNATTNPVYSAVGNAPNVGSWTSLDRLPSECYVSADTSVLLTVSLAATFSYDGTIDDLAARFGAVSKTQGLKYWSTTDNNWRVLVTTASALESADKKSVREDFTAKEILSGETLYFAQNDTRSWGQNVFTMSKIAATADKLTVGSRNKSPVRFGPLKLFGGGDLETVVFISQLNSTNWHYYSLAVIKDSAMAAPEKSLINRQAALYRFLTGQEPDGKPPLSP